MSLRCNDTVQLNDSVYVSNLADDVLSPDGYVHVDLSSGEHSHSDGYVQSPSTAVALSSSCPLTVNMRSLYTEYVLSDFIRFRSVVVRALDLQSACLGFDSHLLRLLSTSFVKSRFFDFSQ